MKGRPGGFARGRIVFARKVCKHCRQGMPHCDINLRVPAGN
jgi:hypothetical protein